MDLIPKVPCLSCQALSGKFIILPGYFGFQQVSNRPSIVFPKIAHTRTVTGDEHPPAIMAWEIKATRRIVCIGAKYWQRVRMHMLESASGMSTSSRKEEKEPKKRKPPAPSGCRVLQSCERAVEDVTTKWTRACLDVGPRRSSQEKCAACNAQVMPRDAPGSRAMREKKRESKKGEMPQLDADANVHNHER